MNRSEIVASLICVVLGNWLGENKSWKAACKAWSRNQIICNSLQTFFASVMAAHVEYIRFAKPPTGTNTILVLFFSMMRANLWKICGISDRFWLIAAIRVWNLVLEENCRSWTKDWKSFLKRIATGETFLIITRWKGRFSNCRFVCVILCWLAYQALTRWFVVLQLKRMSMTRSTIRVLFYANSSKE